MIARDSAGRCVSLLNDEPNEQTGVHPIMSHTNYHPFDLTQSHNSRSSSSSLTTPNLTRADSCEAPFSPKTPTSSHDFNYRISQSSMDIKKDDKLSCQDYEEKQELCKVRLLQKGRKKSSKELPQSPNYEVRGAYSEPLVVDEDSYLNHIISTERTPKRYPCRFRDSHHCQKTFTTSGHASRHSKIHTAEKGVSCSWPGCHKKFTRSDNMKQHLETHTKERLRVAKVINHTVNSSDNNIGTNHNLMDTLTTTSSLTIPAGVKKSLNTKRRTIRNTATDATVNTKGKDVRNWLDWRRF
ncbi:putative c2h2 transcription factor [Erysiphe neolycopersici]|uniref:Putative c2h2 transcription factor n=1 Tax=Erysiphe neolycopersici TaxID=212602 RepID=A0A420I2H3_9PEZI|nr:putative c2h2 transcription factor [Erysiphe neolycopersici]